MPERERLLSTIVDLTARSQGRTRPEILGSTLSLALSLCEADGAVLLLGAARHYEKSVLRQGEAAPTPPTACAPSPFEVSLLRAQQPRAIAGLAASGVSPAAACPGVTPGPALFVPVTLQDRKHGCLAVFRHDGAARFTARDARQLALLAAWAAVAMDGVRLSENLEKLAVTDDLTQVFNYRYLKSALRREVKRASRFHQDLSILMVDVDNLKSYNDRNGHLRGSHLLREIAQLFASQVRSWDLVAKYGGDEFTVILPQTDRVGAAAVAERLREAVEQHDFPLAGRGEITVSCGIAHHPEDGDSVTGLIEAADRALYLAKKNGRNRVEGLARLAA